jgi:hypothetical protein
VSKGQQIRSYDYVNHPYEQVRDALCKDTAGVFQAATKAAAARANSLASELRIDLAGIQLGADISISVKGTAHAPLLGTGGPSSVIQLEWEAANRPHLFPFMKAQLDFSGVYEPPLGVLGSTLNALVGHRIAEGSVHRFVADVAQHLRASLK